MTSTLAPVTTSTTSAPSAEYGASQVSTQAPEKPSEIPISAPSNDNVGTSIPTPDPYFTHFDPRMEHQSYKVGLDVKKLLNNLHVNSPLHACIHRSELVLDFAETNVSLINRKRNSVSRRTIAKRWRGWWKIGLIWKNAIKTCAWPTPNQLKPSSRRWPPDSK